eukprot:3215253-Prymnesium_polylepis.1
MWGRVPSAGSRERQENVASSRERQEMRRARARGDRRVAKRTLYGLAGEVVVECHALVSNGDARAVGQVDVPRRSPTRALRELRCNTIDEAAVARRHVAAAAV